MINGYTSLLSLPFWQDFSHKKILITGATGGLGKFLCHSISTACAQLHIDTEVYASCRNREKAEPIFKGTPVKIIEHPDISAPMPVDIAFDYIIHTANPVGPNFFSSQPEKVLNATVSGTINLLEYARTHGCERFVLASTHEVYGDTAPQQFVAEDALGLINHMSARACYSQGKRAAETALVCYYEKHGLQAMSARLSRFYGPGMNLDSGLFLCDFIKDVLAHNPISVNGAANLLRPLCYLPDAAAALLYILLRGKGGEAYNVQGNELVTIGDIAEIISLYGKTPVHYAHPKTAQLPPAGQVMKTDKLSALGWQQQIPVKKGFEETLAYYTGGSKPVTGAGTADAHPLVSIIVPIYNAQQTLPRCVDSILAQTYPNIEIILVDDASQDNSYLLAEDYSRRHHHVSCYRHSANKGDSGARNTGLLHASGCYIQFVDSDDWIEPGLTQALVEGLEKEDAGLALCSFNKIYNNEKEPVQLHLQGIQPTCCQLLEFANGVPDSLLRFGASWNKLYRKAIITQNKLQFEETKRANEDAHFNFSYLDCIERVYAIDQPLYNYWIPYNRLTMTTAPRPEAFEMNERIYREVRHRITPFLDEKGERILNRHYLDKTLIVLKMLGKADGHYTKETLCEKIREIANHPNILDALANYYEKGTQPDDMITALANKEYETLYHYAIQSN